MGNILVNEKENYDNKLEEIKLKNEALEYQVKIMKEMLKKDDALIKNIETELKEYKLNEENNTCVICKYFDKI